MGERSAPVVMDSVTMAFDDPIDLDDDGTVGVNDFLLLLGAWGACPGGGPCPADLDCDNEVDFFDLLALLNAWG